MFKSKKHFHYQYKGSILLLMLMPTVLVLSFFTSKIAFADTPIVTGVVSAGALSEDASGTYTFSGTIGSAPTFTMPMTTSDLTGAAGGWNLTITSTTLTSGANKLPTAASQITALSAACTNIGTCSSDSLTSSIAPPITIPAATTAPTAVKFFSAAASSGSGVYAVTPTITVTIPGSAKVGSYTCTYTLTVAAGP